MDRHTFCSDLPWNSRYQHLPDQNFLAKTQGTVEQMPSSFLIWSQYFPLLPLSLIGYWILLIASIMYFEPLNPHFLHQCQHVSSCHHLSECCEVASFTSVLQCFTSLIHCPLARQKMFFLECKSKQTAPLCHLSLISLYLQSKRFHPFSSHKALTISLWQPL